jgi:hypothetical protein
LDLYSNITVYGLLGTNPTLACQSSSLMTNYLSMSGTLSLSSSTSDQCSLDLIGEGLIGTSMSGGINIGNGWLIPSTPSIIRVDATRTTNWNVAANGAVQLKGSIIVGSGTIGITTASTGAGVSFNDSNVDATISVASTSTDR